MDDDTGAPTVVVIAARRLVTAAKEYTCGDCGEVIPVGTRYWRGFLLVDGEATATKSHSPSYGACLPERF